MNTKVLELEFQPETVAVVALDDTGRLLIPQVVTYTSIGRHDLGAVCNVVAGSLLCSVWDLCVYQVPSIALDTEVYRTVYGIFRSSSPGEHLFIGYYGVMTIEEEEPPFLYREDGAGNVTPGGLTDQDRADGLEEEGENREDIITLFLSDCYILKPGAQTLRAEVFKTFDNWSTFTSSNVIITNRMLSENLVRRGIVDSNTGYGSGFFIGLESTGFLAGNVTPGGLTDQDRADGLDDPDEGFVRWVCYIYKIPMDTPYVYAHYLNLPALKYKLMIEYKKVMDNLEDPYHLTY